MDMEISKKQETIVIVFCLAIFCFFVFNHIGKAIFWLDEALVANIMPLSYNSIFFKILTDIHPWFYTFLIKSWYLVFGDSEFALRSFSALSAILLLPVIYLISRKWFGKKIALITLALTSTNYFLIWFATQNRPYTLTALISLLSYYFFIEIIETPKKWKNIIYVLVTIFGFYTHLWFYFVFGAQILSILIWRRKQKNILFYQIVALLFAVPSLLISFYQKNLGFNSWIGPVDLNDVLSSFQFFTYNQTLLYIILSFIALLIFISKEEEGQTADNFKIKSLCLYFLVPIISAFIISQYSPIYVAGRYEIIVLPAFLILVAIWWSRINFYILIIAFAILIGTTINIVNMEKDNILNQKSNDKIVVTQILERAENNDLIITTDLSWAVVYYYVNKLKNQKNIPVQSFPEEIESHPGWKNMKEMLAKKETYKTEAVELVKEIKTNKKIKQVWVVYNSNNEIDLFIKKELEKEFGPAEMFIPELSHKNSWFDSVYLFKNNN